MKLKVKLNLKLELNRLRYTVMMRSNFNPQIWETLKSLRWDTYSWLWAIPSITRGPTVTAGIISSFNRKNQRI